MNTLPLEIKHSLFETKEQYLAMRKEWAKWNEHTAAQHLLYAILRGSNWTKAFTRITNSKKIENGHVPWNEGWYHAKQELKAFSNDPWFKEKYYQVRRNEILKHFGGVINDAVATKAMGFFSGKFDEPYISQVMVGGDND